MKRVVLSFALCATGLLLPACGKRASTAEAPAIPSAATTITSFDKPRAGEQAIPGKGIRFEEASLNEVLDRYAEISGRSIIRAGNLPEIKITFSNQSPMSRPEALQTLDTALAAQGVAMVVLGTQYVKAVAAKDASAETGPLVERGSEELPDSSSFVTCVVKLKRVAPAQAAMALQPFAKLPNSIVAIGTGGPSAKTVPGLAGLPAHLLGTKEDKLLILRDYSSNVRRMLQVLEKMEER